MIDTRLDPATMHLYHTIMSVLQKYDVLKTYTVNSQFVVGSDLES